MPTKISVTETQAQAIADILERDVSSFAIVEVAKRGRPASENAKWRMAYNAFCENPALIEESQYQVAMLLGISQPIVNQAAQAYRADKASGKLDKQNT